MDSSGNAVADFGRFLTGFLVLMGVGKFVQSNAILLPVASASRGIPSLSVLQIFFNKGGV